MAGLRWQGKLDTPAVMFRRALPLLVGVAMLITACPASESSSPSGGVAAPSVPAATATATASAPTPTPSPATVTGEGEGCESNQDCGPNAYCREPQCMLQGAMCTAKVGCTESGGPVCGCDDKSYPTACAAQKAGASVSHAGRCGSGSCGGRGGGSCGPNQYCRFSSSSCDRADRSGTCTDYPETCGPAFEPVVSCRGQRFDNVCEAHKAGAARLAPARDN